MTEQVVTFGKAGTLVGVMHVPPAETIRSGAPGIILLNAGLVHRVGPNRLYVKLARMLAEMGYVVLRFDFSGFGDSTVRTDHLPLVRSIVDETQEAMNFFAAARGFDKFLLMGLCSGATASLKTAAIDERAVGVVLINVRASGAELKSYIKGRSAVRKYWNFAKKNRTRILSAVREKMHVQGLLNVFRTLGRDLGSSVVGKKSFPEAEETAAEIRSLNERGIRTMILCSEWDPGLDFLKVVLGEEAMQSGERGLLRVEIIPAADHTFTPVAKQKAVIEHIRSWIRNEVPAAKRELHSVI